MIFPSEGWLQAVVARVNGHPDLPRALAGLGADLCAVVEADPPALRAPFAAYGRHEGGRIGTVRVLEDVDEVWELEPAYVVRAPYRVWKTLLGGGDPLRAVLAGRVKVKGNLEQLTRRVSFRYILDGALATVKTEFAG